MLDNTSSIICAFYLAADIPRSLYRSLELCRIALNPACVCGIIVIFFAFSYTLRRSFAP
ncbi:MAG: hypothetical protein WBO61_10920 [Gemmiger qucibialis]